jgi:4-diphosphocytidyl-2C-methyl-D-erythritol kinase
MQVVSLAALAHVWEIQLNKRELIEIAEELGADVPFFCLAARRVPPARQDPYALWQTR